MRKRLTPRALLLEHLCHERRTPHVIWINARVAASVVESNGGWIDVGLNTHAAMRARETFGLLEETTAVAPPLQVCANGDAPQGCHRAAHINANDADGDIGSPENQRIVAGTMVVWMIRVVG